MFVFYISFEKKERKRTKKNEKWFFFQLKKIFFLIITFIIILYHIKNNLCHTIILKMKKNVAFCSIHVAFCSIFRSFFVIGNDNNIFFEKNYIASFLV